MIAFILVWSASNSQMLADADLRQELLSPAETGTPRETLQSFLESTEGVEKAYREMTAGGSRPADFDWLITRGLSTLDLSQIPEYLLRQKSRESALMLREVLDRVELPDLATIPGPGDSEIPATYTIPGTAIQITRIKEGQNQGEFLFSSETVDSIDEVYERAKVLPYQSGAIEGFYEKLRFFPRLDWMWKLVSTLPPEAHRTWFGLAIWQWVGYAAAILVSLLILSLLYLLGRASRRIDPSRHKVGLLVSSVIPLTGLLVPIALKQYVSLGLSIYGDVLAVTNFVANVVLLLIALFSVWAIGYRIVEVAAAAADRSDSRVNALLIRLFGKLLTIFAGVVVLIEGGDSLGIPMTTLLAGAGVGGLALALGAQAAVKNLVGSMMILLDSPFKAGERIVAKGFDGVVEDVGIRSTRMRLRNGQEATLPNEMMAQVEVTNISRRLYIQKVFLFHLPLDTGAAKVSQALSLLRKRVEGHEGESEKFPPRVMIGDIGREAIEIRAIVWYHASETGNFPAWLETTTLQILRDLEDADIQLIPPARWIQSEGDDQASEPNQDITT